VRSLERKIQASKGNPKLLQSIETGEMISPAQAFSLAASASAELFSDLEPNGPGKYVHLRVSYPDDRSHFVVDTEHGPVRLTEILFSGELSNKETTVPASSVQEYVRDATGEVIAQSAAFMIDSQALRLSLEMHRLADTGQIHIVARKL
jgi:hypothetical protein